MARRRRLPAGARRRTWWWYRGRPAKYGSLAHWDTWLQLGTFQGRRAHLRPLCEYGYVMGLDALRRQWHDVQRGWYRSGPYGKKYERVANAVRDRVLRETGRRELAQLGLAHRQ